MSGSPPRALLIGPYDPHGGEYTFLAPPLGVWRLAGVLEAHGYAGRETLLDILAERINWFDKWVKNAPPRVKQQTAAN